MKNLNNMPTPIEKLATIITNSFEILGKKIDNLISALNRAKPPVVNVEPPEIPEIKIPDITVPEASVKVDVPEIDTSEIPEAIKEGFNGIKIPEAKVKVEAPEINTLGIQSAIIKGFNGLIVPQSKIPEFPKLPEFPKSMKVEGMETLIENTSKEEQDIAGNIADKLLTVKIIDSKGRQISNFGGDMTAPSVVGLKNTDKTNINPATEEKQDDMITALDAINIDTDGLAQETTLTDGSQKTQTVDPSGNDASDVFAKYQIADKDDDAEPNYFGFTDVNGNWYILKEENNTYRYVSGSSGYATNWSNRASQSYDYLYNITIN